MIGNNNSQYAKVATTEDAGADSTPNREALIDSSNLQTATAIPMVEVVAPATLPEGYKFDAQVGSQLVSVTVQMGGVEEGQRFTIPLTMPSSSTAGATSSSSASGGDRANFDIHAMAQPRVQVPIGTWKDHWCNFCGFGCCHAVLCNAYCCTPGRMDSVRTETLLYLYMVVRGMERGTTETVEVCLRVISPYGKWLRASDCMIRETD